MHLLFLSRMDLSTGSVWDVLLVPLTLCITTVYHVYVWRSAIHHVKGTGTWFRYILKEQEQEKKGMLTVQSLRNSLMAAIFAGSVAIVLMAASAALSNNCYNAFNGAPHLQGGGSQTILVSPAAGGLLIFKWALTYFLLMVSFVFSSMAIGQLTDASFLLNAPPEFTRGSTAHQVQLESGHALAVAGTRALYIAVGVSTWLLGPVPMLLSSAGLLLMFYLTDFSH